MARIVVVGGSGRIGAKIVATLRRRELDVVAASPTLGVNSVTGQGLADALTGARVVIDASNAPSVEDKPAIEFFATSTMNLLDTEKNTGVAHHVVVSVVATDRLQDSGYFRAKLAQEELVKASDVPYSIVRATPVYDFIEVIADAATDDDTVRVPDALIQPTDAAEVAEVIADIALGQARNDIVEVAGPQQFTLEELIREVSAAQHRPRNVVADAHTRYFGTLLDKHTLLAAQEAVITSTSLQDWIADRISGR